MDELTQEEGQAMATEGGEEALHATTEANGSGEHEAGHETAWGFDTYGWVAIAMITVILLMLWRRVPSVVAGAMDRQIDAIRKEIEEASKLREEAEALKAEYEAKTANADSEAATIIDRARDEANDILEKAEQDADALIERRKQLAEDKIAAAERSAVSEVRAKAAQAATAAAASLIESKHDAEADKALVDKTISGLDTPLN